MSCIVVAGEIPDRRSEGCEDVPDSCGMVPVGRWRLLVDNIAENHHAVWGDLGI